MPKVDPFQYLISSLSTLTGGLISDMQTLFLGILFCAFLFMGFEHLMEALGHAIESRSRDRYLDLARSTKSRLKGLDWGSAEYDQASLQYREYIRKSIRR